MIMNEGQVDMLNQYFKGVSYTSPTWYFGLGADTGDGGYFASEDPTNTADRMTTGAPSPPTTNNFVDVGSRIPVDFSAGAIVSSLNVVKKFAPPTTNFTELVSAPNTDSAYLISADGTGPSDPPVVLLSQWVMTRNLEDLPVPGDFFEVTLGTFFILQ